MLSQTVSIVFAMGFISVVSGLNAEQSAYKAAFKCFKAGHDADAHSLEAKGMNANKEEMIESSCLFAKVSFEFIGFAIREGAKEKGVYKNKIKIHKIPRLTSPRELIKGSSLTLSRRLFFVIWGRGRDGGIPPSPVQNFASIKAMTVRLGEKILSFKLS